MAIPSWVAVGVAALLTLAGDRAGAQIAARLVPVQHYGWEDVTAATRPLTDLERKLQGAVFADVGAVAEGPDGALYVLDNDDLKVVVFNRDGTLRRVFGGVRGRGPGEFEWPRDIAISDGGELFVLDQALSRVVVFDTAGTFRRIITLGISSPLFVGVHAGKVYVTTGIIRGDRPVLHVYDVQGTLLERIYTPDAESAEFGRAGEAFRLARTRDGALVVANPDPGIWTPLADPTRRMGTPIVPDNRVQQRPNRNTWFAPASIRGFEELGDGRLLVYYLEYGPSSPTGATSYAFKLALRTGAGAPIGSVALPPEGTSRVFKLTRDRTEVLLSVTEPHPQLIRYRLVER